MSLVNNGDIMSGNIRYGSNNLNFMVHEDKELDFELIFTNFNNKMKKDKVNMNKLVDVNAKVTEEVVDNESRLLKSN